MRQVKSIEECIDNIFDDVTVKKLLKSEKDIEKGRTKKATEVISELKKKYGL